MAYRKPIIINHAPDDSMIEYDGESTSKSPYHKEKFVDKIIEKIKVERENNLKKDPKRNWRSEIQECKLCAYSSQFGGQAITMSHCLECGREMIFPSTNVDVYCIDCARKLNKCKHCGNQMD